MKDNQPTLHHGVEDFFLGHMEDDFARVAVGRHETKEKGHGRTDHRSYYVCTAPAELPDRERWPDLAAVGAAINVSTRDGEPSDAVRYDILSRRLDAEAFADAVRGRWGIENSLHWQLDVSFGEYRCRVRAGLADHIRAVGRGRAASPRRLRPGQAPQGGILAKPADDRHSQLLGRLEDFLLGIGPVGHHPDR